MRNHLWCPNDPHGHGIDDDDDDDDDDDEYAERVNFHGITLKCGMHRKVYSNLERGRGRGKCTGKGNQVTQVERNTFMHNFIRRYFVVQI